MAFEFFPGEEDTLTGDLYVKNEQAPRYLREFMQAGFTRDEAFHLTELSVEQTQKAIKEQLYELHGAVREATPQPYSSVPARISPVQSAINRTLNENR